MPPENSCGIRMTKYEEQYGQLYRITYIILTLLDVFFNYTMRRTEL